MSSTDRALRREILLTRGMLALLVISLIGLNVAWLVVDQHPTDMDQGRYMLMVKDFADGFARRDATFCLSLIIGNHPSHPHLVPLLAAVLFVAGGRSPDAAYFINTLAYVGIVSLIFLTATHLTDRRVGALAAILGAGFSPIAMFSRLFLLEEGAAFFVILSHLLLLKTNELRSLPRSLALGIAVGLAALAKWTTLAFIAPAVVVVGVASSIRHHTTRPLAMSAAAGAAAVVIAGPWYVSRWATLMQFLRYAEEGRGFSAGGAGWHQLGTYLWGVGRTAGPHFAALGLLGMVVLIMAPSTERVALLAAIIVPTAFFSFFVDTSGLRHLLPAFPIVVVAAAIGIASLRQTAIRRGTATIAVLLAVISVFQSGWGLLGRNDAVLLAGRSVLLFPAPRLPDPRDWKFATLLEVIARQVPTSTTGRRRTTVRVVAGNLPFRPNGFAFLAAERFPSLVVAQVPFHYPVGNSQHAHLGARTLIETDYLLVRSGDVNGNVNGLMHYSRAMQRFLERVGPAENVFQRIYALELPGNGTAWVVRSDGVACGSGMLEFLDWAHELDADDPDIPRLVETCSDRRREDVVPWGLLLQALRPSSPPSAPRSVALRRLTSAYPEIRWSKRLLAEALVDEGSNAEAAHVYEAIGRGAPYECSALIRAGSAWRHTGQPGPAREALLEGLGDTPDCADGHRQLRGVELALGNAEGAALEERIIALLENQERLGPAANTARFRLALGDLARQAGRLVESRYHYRRGLANEPSNRQIRRRLEIETERP